MRLYKPTNNLAVDMVAACINHAERRRKKVKVIYLKVIYWIMFTDYVKQTAPEYEFTHEVDFDGTLVRKATIFQPDALYYQLEKEVASI